MLRYTTTCDHSSICAIAKDAKAKGNEGKGDEMPENYRIKFLSGIPGACLLLEDGTSGIYENDVKRFISALERGTWLILKKDKKKE